MLPFPRWRKTVRKWLVGLLLLGVVAAWAWRLVREISQPPPHLIHGAGWGDDEPLPQGLEQWMEKEGLVPPPV
jgi:hypothetical protein